MAGKRLPKGISIRKDGRYQARYTLNGKRYTIYGKTQKEVEKKLRDAQYEIEHGIFARPEKITVDSWFQTWIEEFQKNSIRETTYRMEKGLYNTHLKDQIGKMLMKDVRVEHIQKILNGMCQKGYKRSYIERVRGIAHAIFEQAYKSEIIYRNPVSFTNMPKAKERKERRVLTSYEQEVFLKCAEGNQYENVFYLGFSTGMRISEILALEWSDVDFSRNEISITGSLTQVGGKEYEKTLPKTPSSVRTIPVLPEIMKRLRKHKLEQAKYKMMYGEALEPVAGLENLVFTTPVGRPVARSRIFYVIDRIIEDMNHYERMKAREEKRKPITFAHFSSHAMRHTFATRALEKGIPPKVVQEILGHSSIKITMDIYTHVLPETKQEEIKKIANLF